MIALHLVYQSELIEVKVNDTAQYIQTVWLKHPNPEEFRKEIRITADFMLSYDYKKVLFDVRKRVYQDIGDQMADEHWVEQEIVPLFRDKKNLRFAYLVTQASYENMYTSQMHGLILDRPEFYKDIEVGVFLDLAEAQDWLLNG